MIGAPRRRAKLAEIQGSNQRAARVSFSTSIGANAMISWIRSGFAGAALMVAAVATPAMADTKVFAKSGIWEAYSGTSDDSTKVCGILASGGGRWFGFKYFAGDSEFTVQMSKDTWEIPKGTKVSVALTFDDDTPWKAQATSFKMSDGDDGLQFGIPFKQATNFLQEFQAADSMTVEFPSQKALKAWEADMKGSHTIVEQFGKCLQRL
jgi:hypothetical protein